MIEEDTKHTIPVSKMGSPSRKEVRIILEEDRISRLPDELIHRIMSFLDTKQAVRTCILSKRWNLVWTTLPFLNFRIFDDKFRFIPHFFLNRNHQSSISELNLCVYAETFPGTILEMLVEYAVEHNVEFLNLDIFCDTEPFMLSGLSSNTLKKLTLAIEFYESGSWNLPVLTTLDWRCPAMDEYCEFPDSCLACLPSLTDLHLVRWDLSISSFSFSLPNLTTLCLSECTLSQTIWDFPALVSLDMHNVILPENVSDILSALVNLRNLTLSLKDSAVQRDHFISCPRLMNLNIGIKSSLPHNIVVLAPKLCNFSSVGIFSITFGVSELKNVDVKLHGSFENLDFNDRKKYFPRFTSMLSGLGNAKNLSFDMESIQALSAISDLLASFPSPFYNLRYVKLPRGYKELSIPCALRSYLLGGSPRATLVTTLPQKNIITPTPAVSVTAKNSVLQEPLVAPTKELVDCQYINKSVCVDTVNMKLQEQHVVENSLLDADSDRVRQNGELIVGISNNRESSSRGNEGLWRGHEVKSEFVCLLDRIMHKYPETFEHFTTENKKLCTMNLNMLCTSLNDFTKISTTDVDSEMIVGYRDVFCCLQNQGFNVSWLVNRLNYIEHLRFSGPLVPELHAIECRIGDAKSKLQDLQALRMEKITEIQKAFGTMGSNLAAGFIGDDLLSGP